MSDSCELDDFKYPSKLIIFWLVSCVKYDVSHNLEYNEKMFPSTILTFSNFFSNSTYVSVISLDIFLFTFIWNFLLDHSSNFALVSRYSFCTWSTILDSFSMISLVSLGTCKLNASKKMSFISINACLYL